MSLIYKGQTVANVGGGSSGVSMEQVNAAIQDAVADIQPQEVYPTRKPGSEPGLMGSRCIGLL